MLVLTLLLYSACTRSDSYRDDTVRRQSAKQSASGYTVRVAETNLRSIIKSKVMPEYPAESLTHKAHGVIVAQMNFDMKGRVEQVRVLESPDKYIERSAHDALKQWTIHVILLKGAPVKIQGKLTFYAACENNKGRVFMP